MADDVSHRSPTGRQLTAEAKKLANSGVSDHEIAARLGLDVATTRALIGAAIPSALDT
jgi:hypothetical protein